MRQLIKLIGPAPSEITEFELIEKLRKERFRVVTSLDTFKAAAVPKKKASASKKKTTAPSVSKKIVAACKAAGITIDEFLETRRKMQEEIKNND